MKRAFLAAVVALSVAGEAEACWPFRCGQSRPVTCCQSAPVPAQSVAPPAPAAYYQPVQSAPTCPNGRCPNQAAPATRGWGLFR